jgi:predicted DNA-binding antitoxin AbrB/MazE fold protein
MTHQFHAIYEHGILRPVTPLNLPEMTEVVCTIHEKNGTEQPAFGPSSDELRHQKEALDAMFREVDRLPQTPRNDGLSGRDHDRILYGNRP